MGLRGMRCSERQGRVERRNRFVTDLDAVSKVPKGEAPGAPSFRGFIRSSRPGPCVGLLFWVDEGTVDYGAALGLEGRTGGAEHALDHADEDDVVGGVDPEPGSGGTVPVEGALAFGEIGFGWVENDGAVVAVAEAGSHDLGADAEFAGEQLIRNVVGGHELDCCRRKDAPTIELAAVEQH